MNTMAEVIVESAELVYRLRDVRQRICCSYRFSEHGIDPEGAAREVSSHVNRRGDWSVKQLLERLRLEWAARVGPGDIAAVEAAVCCEVMLRGIAKLSRSSLPGEIKNFVWQEFVSILSRVEAGEWVGLVSPTDHPFHVYRRCLVRTIPVGIYYFEYSGIPRINLLKCPLKERPRLVHFLATRMHGFAPTIEMHLPQLERGRFTREQVAQSYKLIASVLSSDPVLRGISGSSWFYDPEVARISPHLGFIRELIEENRGLIHRLGPSAIAVTGAIATSSKRRRLYEEGRYLPIDYARYWARDDVIRWAQGRHSGC